MNGWKLEADSLPYLTGDVAAWGAADWSNGGVRGSGSERGSQPGNLARRCQTAPTRVITRSIYRHGLETRSCSFIHCRWESCWMELWSGGKAADGFAGGPACRSRGTAVCDGCGDIPLLLLVHR